MIIAVDFDGTLCENRWPNIGAPNRRLIDRLIKARRLGDKVILWTMRTNTPVTVQGEERDLLQEALDFCEDHGLIFDSVNAPDPENAAQFGDYSRKIYADVYIDDHNSRAGFMSEYLIPYVHNLADQKALEE